MSIFDFFQKLIGWTELLHIVECIQKEPIFDIWKVNFLHGFHLRLKTVCFQSSPRNTQLNPSSRAMETSGFMPNYAHRRMRGEAYARTLVDTCSLTQVKVVAGVVQHDPLHAFLMFMLNKTVLGLGGHLEKIRQKHTHVVTDIWTQLTHCTAENRVLWKPASRSFQEARREH